MIKMKRSLVVAGLFSMAILAAQCNNDETKKTDSSTEPGVKPPVGGKIVPKELPSVVPGFNFPEDSNTIYGWLQPNYDSTSVYKHAWGIWAGLTSESGEKFNGENLLIYQTWMGISEIQSIIINENNGAGGGELIKNELTPLTVPNQLKHANKFRMARNANTVDNNPQFLVAVSYDPNAASHTIKNKLLDASVLASYQKPNAIGSIPVFPTKGITIKPVYYVGNRKDSLIRIPVWPGTPKIARPFPSSAWGSYVYIDVSDSQPAGKKIVPTKNATFNPSTDGAAVCNLKDFIHFKVTPGMVKVLAGEGDSTGTGGIAILVAMHVTSKEISNWTWQTFYWAPDPAQPFAPSSNLAASLRPSQLVGAASHYAVSTAYTELTPNQPVTGGKNTGAAMIGFNPYLEAEFDAAVFSFPNTYNPSFKYGVQTNCMSCHALATADGDLGYSTDQYVDMAGKYFNNRVQLDFAWSIQGNIIVDTPKKQ